MDTLFSEIQQKHKTRYYSYQKKRFREFAIGKFNEIGYQNVTVDKHKNIIVGDVDNAKYVASAHYDTPPLSFYLTPFTRIFGHLIGAVVASIAFIGLLIALLLFLSYLFDVDFVSNTYFVFILFFLMFLFPNPSNANDNTSGVLSVFSMAKKLIDDENKNEYAFVLFNCEELGLLGSSGFARSFKKRNGRAADFELYNFDCVALGSKILIASKKNSKPLQKLLEASKDCGYPIITIKAGIFTVASDNLNFKNSAMLTGVKPSLFGAFYLPKIHMPNDNKLDSAFTEKIVDIVISATKQR